MEEFIYRNFNNKLQIPLYKYYGEDKYSYIKDLIEKKEIHLEDPSTYNDIYDSTFVIDIKDLCILKNSPTNLFNIIIKCLHENDKDKVKYEHHKNLFDKCDNLQETLDIVLKKYKDIIDCNSLINGLEEYIGLNRPRYAMNNKVTCFSETVLSIPMWSYYGSKHRGVCVQFKFDEKDPLLKHIHKVSYTDFYNKNPNNFINYFTKSRQWEHEQEWRIVCETTKEYLPIKAELSIILGARQNPSTYLPYWELAHKYKLDLYILKQSSNSFNLEMEKLMDKGNPIDNEIQI